MEFPTLKIPGTNSISWSSLQLTLDLYSTWLILGIRFQPLSLWSEHFEFWGWWDYFENSDELLLDLWSTSFQVFRTSLCLSFYSSLYLLHLGTKSLLKLCLEKVTIVMQTFERFHKVCFYWCELQQEKIGTSFLMIWCHLNLTMDRLVESKHLRSENEMVSWAVGLGSPCLLSSLFWFWLVISLWIYLLLLLLMVWTIHKKIRIHSSINRILKSCFNYGQFMILLELAGSMLKTCSSYFTNLINH